MTFHMSAIIQEW